jgi:hypothetical protein
MRNTADVTGGKPIAVLFESILDVSAINPLLAFYDIHGGKREEVNRNKAIFSAFHGFSVHVPGPSRDREPNAGSA